MTATEQITAEDLVLLATEVMGYTLITRTQIMHEPGEVMVNVSGHVILCHGISRVKELFAPHKDTAEGLWQAKQLREKWRAQGTGRACVTRQREDGGYSATMEDWSGELGSRWDGAADAEPLAIVRAVLAALEAES